MSMSLREDTLQGMDPLTYSAIIEIQLEDSLALASSSKGKQREGTVSDAELALQMYMEDLRSTRDVLADRKMAQSIALAVLRDGQFIRRAHQQEDQVARDRQLAMTLHNNTAAAVPVDHQSEPNANVGSADPWTDEEMLAKAAAMYNQDVTSTESLLPALISDSGFGSSPEDKPQAESSSWAASRNGNEKRKVGHCVACGDEKEFYDVARTPCNHEYCRECLASLFRASMVDETLFPPRCDGQVIQLNQVRFFLPPDLAKEFEVKSVELSSKNRVYCHDPRCSTFIPTPTGTINDDSVSCPRCEKTTCVTCKAVSHTGDCPEDTSLQQLKETAEAAQWQRCFRCHRFVELEQGCNHMTFACPKTDHILNYMLTLSQSCPCGAHFCYLCGQEWKKCGCPQWEEPRLYARAAHIVDRAPDPRRRLFQPMRVARSQPHTRRPSLASNTTGPAVAATDARMGPGSAWESDFSDQSEWEQDWLTNCSETDEATAISAGTYQAPAAATSATQDADLLLHEEAPSRSSDVAVSSIANLLHGLEETDLRQQRDQDIADMVEHLRASHACIHEKWRYVRGRHECEECHHVLPQYIFECRQCHVQACNRCRRSRLM